jgi:hypothetical protein
MTGTRPLEGTARMSSSRVGAVSPRWSPLSSVLFADSLMLVKMYQRRSGTPHRTFGVGMGADNTCVGLHLVEGRQPRKALNRLVGQSLGEALGV